MPDLLQNVVLSQNPCPICMDANGRQMTYDEWAESEWGLPGSSARYCEDDCHCILIEAGLIDQFPAISEKAKLRGEEGTEILAIIELSPTEEGLKDIMDLWNKNLGKLPPEIYQMDAMKVEEYLRKLYKAKTSGGAPGALRGASAYLNEKINFGGEIVTRADAIRTMTKEGASQRMIDAYMMGARTIE